MIQDISYHVFFGIPFVVIIGIATLLCFICTALIALAHRRGMKHASYALHYRVAIISLFLGIFHVILALSPYIGV